MVPDPTGDPTSLILRPCLIAAVKAKSYLPALSSAPVLRSLRLPPPNPTPTLASARARASCEVTLPFSDVSEHPPRARQPPSPPSAPAEAVWGDGAHVQGQINPRKLTALFHSLLFLSLPHPSFLPLLSFIQAVKTLRNQAAQARWCNAVPPCAEPDPRCCCRCCCC